MGLVYCSTTLGYYLLQPILSKGMTGLNGSTRSHMPLQKS